MYRYQYYKTQDACDMLSKPERKEAFTIQWTTEKVYNTSSPSVWGPAFWFSLHNGSIKYPLKADRKCADRMKGFIIGIPCMLPCETCSQHATAYIDSNMGRLDDITSGRDNLFKFFVDFHNYVNRRLGKPEMSYERAFAMYSGDAKISRMKY